jgi:hypothetical protein
MLVNSFFGFAHALTHWSARWIFRGCEDSLINFDRLVDFDHVVLATTTSVSCKTVETLVEIGPSVCQRMNTFEDAFFTQIVYKYALNASSCASSAFFGFCFNNA